MAAVAGIIGSVLSAANGGSNQMGNSVNQTAQTSQVSNAVNNKADIKNADVNNAAETIQPTGNTGTITTPTIENKATSNSTDNRGMDWQKLASMAEGLAGSGGSPAQISAQNAANTQPVSNFK